MCFVFFFSSRRRHTRCALVTGVQTCALPILTPEAVAELEHAHIDPMSHWALEHVSGGGEPDRMYLADPLDHRGCSALVGGEQLVFRRHFTDVDKIGRASCRERVGQYV